MQQYKLHGYKITYSVEGYADLITVSIESLKKLGGIRDRHVNVVAQNIAHNSNPGGESVRVKVRHLEYLGRRVEVWRHEGWFVFRSKIPRIRPKTDRRQRSLLQAVEDLKVSLNRDAGSRRKSLMQHQRLVITDAGYRRMFERKLREV